MPFSAQAVTRTSVPDRDSRGMTDSLTAEQPRFHVWLVEARLAIAERPGGGGRSHRRARRQGEQEWWRANGMTDIVSGLRSRHGLVEYGLGGFGIHWFPITDNAAAGEAVAALVQRTEALLAEDRCVLVHVDRANGWLAGVDASLRLGLGLAGNREEAMLQVARDGLPLDEVAETLVAGYVDASRGVKLA